VNKAAYCAVSAGFVWLAGLGFPSGARADAAADAPAATDGALGEIVVVAEKRSENAMTVPIAITSVTRESLQSVGIENTGELQLVTPGLVFNEFNGFPLYYIRGVGTDFTQPGVNPAVGIYSDGIYQPFTSSQAQSLLDVDHVEVLKGPQGTLYGRNTTAGAINVITRDPSTDKTEAELQIGAGNYHEKTANAYFSAPITSGLSVSLAGQFERERPFETNGDPQHPIADYLSSGIRGKAVYDFGGGAKAEVALWYFRLDDDAAGAFQQLQPDSTGAVYGPLIGGGQQSSGPKVFFADAPSYWKMTQRGADIKLRIPSTYFDFVSLTGYQDFKTTSILDFDGTDAPIAFFGSPQPTQTFTQEFQFISNGNGPLQWVGGLYYIDNKSGFDPLTVPAGAEPPLTVAGPNELITANTRSQSPAAYAQGNYKFGPDDAWRVTVGGRYSRETAKFDPAYVDVTGVGQVASFPYASRTWNDFSPKFTLDYTAGQSLTYFTVAKGFKAGSYNVASPGDLVPVEPEKLISYELGYKLTFADGRARFEAAAYDYQYTDLQVQFITSQSAPLTLGNAQKAEARGVELSLVAEPTKGLTFTGGIAWEPTAKYTEYGQTLANGSVVNGGVAYTDNGAGNTASIANFSGNRLAHVPKLSGNVGADYLVKLTSAGDALRLSANVYYSDNYYLSAQNTPRVQQSAYSTVNAKVS
jgi:iron complex outermembrane receptor protein